MIEKLYETAKCYEKVKALSNNKCNRCNGTNIYIDEYKISYCLDCFSYGEINDSMQIYRYIRDIPRLNHELVEKYNLTEIQRKGSDFLLKCYLDKEPGILQAVCGAGKTEMTYRVIHKALNENKKICLVIPRVEVLKEISIRYKEAFPKTIIKLLFEGNKDYLEANLLISTPQQLINFYFEFDLMIIDEIDAFPFADNPFLERLVEKSIKRNGIKLYMSATLTNSLDTQIKNKTLRHFVIPNRYHYHDLIIPRFIKLKNNKLYTQIDEIVQFNLTNKRQCLIFVPSINKGEEILSYINKDSKISDFISSKSKYKKQIISSFRNKHTLFLISTTILERGVTFDNIDCLVLYSDNVVFTKQTLIQISGRVGRNHDDQSGYVIYLSEYISKSMKQAKREILEMNRRKNNAM
jgi:competence protein ComFA